MPNKRREIDWDGIRQEWEVGQLTIKQIAQNFGVSDAAIHLRARRKGWPPRQNSPPVVRGVVSRAFDSPEPLTNQRAALIAFQRAIELLSAHRKSVSDLRTRIEASLRRVEAVIAKRQEQGRSLTLKEEAMVMGILRDAANALARLIPIERRAFGFTDQDGPSEFDGMTEQEIEAVENLIRRAIG